MFMFDPKNITIKFQALISTTVGGYRFWSWLLANRDYSSHVQCNCMYFQDFKMRLLWLGKIFL